MCKAFSCIVTDQGDVRWKIAIDSHSELLRLFGVPDKTANKKEICFAKVEISPANNNYIRPDKWVFTLDESVKPDWWNPECEALAWAAHKKWYRALRRMLVNKPIVHPFRDRNPKKISTRQLALLKKWASVRDSVGASVRASVRDSVRDSVGASVRASVRDSVWASVGDSVRDSVGASVWDSVRDSVWASVRDSVRDSVWAYSGSHFKLSRKAWKYTDKIKCKGYPFQPCVDLWEMGLVPSYDGKKWRLHRGKDAKIMWEGELNG